MPNQLNIEVKICGLSDVSSIEAALDGGANHIGFIFFPKSPRNISPEDAGELAKHVRGRAKIVAVSVDADDAFLDEIVGELSPDILQLHGSESPERVGKIKLRYDLPAMKAFAIRQKTDFDRVEPYFDIADRLLFDAKPPKGSDLPGGNGVSFDWSLFAQWQESYGLRIPAMLSGGLDGDNITQALLSSNARAIDISSGVEKAAGIKDPKLIAAFLDQIRNFSRKENR